MRRREFIKLIGRAGAAWPLAARAQITTNVQRVGILDASTPGGYTDQHYWRAFRDQMRTLGYVEGTNVEFDARWANGNRAALPGLTSELLRLPVRVIVALSAPVAQAAKSVTNEVPIVVPLMADPVAVGLVASLARPGGNVIGLATISAELSAKRLDLSREMVPNLSHAAIIWAESIPPFALTVRHTEITAKSLGVALRVVGVSSARDFEEAVAELSAERVQGVIVAVPAGGLFTPADLAQLTAILAQRRLPAIYAEREYVHTGGLVSYGPDYPIFFAGLQRLRTRYLRAWDPRICPWSSRRNSC